MRVLLMVERNFQGDALNEEPIREVVHGLTGVPSDSIRYRKVQHNAMGPSIHGLKKARRNCFAWLPSREKEPTLLTGAIWLVISGVLFVLGFVGIVALALLFKAIGDLL